jgi:mono/diheme cytochrome c family protein
MARRASYWGLFSDVYRARTCLADAGGGAVCATAALLDATKHVAKVDAAVGASSSDFSAELASITGLVQAKELAAAKARVTLFREKLIADFANNTAPVLQPSRTLGQKIFSEYCGSCHGDGLGAPGKLTPQLRVHPRSFGLAQRGSTQSPFGVYSVMIHGVDDSEMASMLDILSVDELWSVAFYVTSLPYVGLPSVSPSGELGGATPELAAGDFDEWLGLHGPDFALSTLAVSTDEELVARLGRLGRVCGECKMELQILRNEWPWSGKTGRLGDVAQSPRQKTETRALVMLLGSIILISTGFYIVLRRSGRIE